MPRTRARGKSPRARSKESLRAKVCHLALQMEQPLDDATDYVQALGLMGYGMMGSVADGDERAVVTVARSATKSLETAREAWNEVFKAVRPRKVR